MPKINAHITQEQKDFLENIVFEDAASSLGGKDGHWVNAVQWCIDACMKIEALYKVDACYVGHFDVREDEHNPKKLIQS